MATCTKCGKLNYEGVEYCTACGSPLSGSSNSYSDEEYSDPETEQDQEEVDQDEEIKQPKNDDEPVDKRRLFMIVGIALALVITGVLLYFFVFSSGGGVKMNFGIKDIETKELSKSDTVLVGAEVVFEDVTKGAETWLWNFGDPEETESLDQLTTHSYDQPDEYWVRLTVNGKYTDSLKVIVIEPPAPEEIQAKFSIEGSRFVGEVITFTDNTPDVKESNWYFPDLNLPMKGQKITYVPKRAGAIEVTLKNDKALNEQIKLTIKEKPEPGASVAPPKPKPVVAPSGPKPPKPEPAPKEPKPVKVLGITEKEKQDLAINFQKLLGNSDYEQMEKFVNRISAPDGTAPSINGKNAWDFIQSDLQMAKKSKKITVVKAEKNAKKGYNSIQIEIK